MPGISSTLRSSTSAQIMSAIAPSRAHAASANASSTLPQACERRSKLFLREQLLHLRAVLRRQLDEAGPARLVGLLHVLLRSRVVEADRLDAGRGLALDFLLRVRFPEIVAAFERERLALQELALLRGERLPLLQVDDQRDFGVVEARVDAEFRLLLPVEIEDAADRPAVAVDDAALQGRVDL